MLAAPALHQRFAPGASTASALAGVFVDEVDRDRSLVSIPRPEVQLVVRFGVAARGGIDAHAFGFRDRVHRKRIRAGQWTVTARLRLGAQQAVLGVPASEVAGRIVALEDLWGDAATRRLIDRLGAARARSDAATIVEHAIADRVVAGRHDERSVRFAHDAAERLATSTVSAVADDLGVSERHLRRVFREAVGVSPKAYAKLQRFHRALRVASDRRGASWATIAVAAGYYDQAHLIDDFRTIAGVTPRVLVGELAVAAWPPTTGARSLQLVAEL